MLSYKRSVRVAELIQQEISKILFEIKDPHFGFVTITGVKITDDLKEAKVFYSVLGDEEAKNNAKDVLNRAAHFIKYSLGRRIQLRFIPKLEFISDTTPEKASKVFDLLKKIEDEKNIEKKAAKKPAAKKKRQAAVKPAIKKKSKKKQ